MSGEPCPTCGASYLAPGVTCGGCGGAFFAATAVQTERTNEIIVAEFPDQLSPQLAPTAPPAARVFGVAIVVLTLALLVVVYVWRP